MYRSTGLPTLRDGHEFPPKTNLKRQENVCQFEHDPWKASSLTGGGAQLEGRLRGYGAPR